GIPGRIQGEHDPASTPRLVATFGSVHLIIERAGPLPALAKLGARRFDRSRLVVVREVLVEPTHRARNVAEVAGQAVGRDDPGAKSAVVIARDANALVASDARPQTGAAEHPAGGEHQVEVT